MRRIQGLTKRQADVVRLVRRGLSNAEIAGELGITEDGVKAHLSRLYLRFGVTNRAALIATVDDGAADSNIATLGELRAISGRAHDRQTRLAGASRLSDGQGRLETVRSTLAAVDVALDLVRDLPPETTGPMLEALRRRVAEAVTALDSIDGSLRPTGAS